MTHETRVPQSSSVGPGMIEASESGAGNTDTVPAFPPLKDTSGGRWVPVY